MLHYLYAHGTGRINAPGHHVHVIFLQHPPLNRLQRIVHTVLFDETFSTSEIVCSIIPQTCLTQIVAAEYQAFSRQRIACFQEILIHLGSIGLAPHALEGRSTIDIVACPLFAGIVGTSIRQLIVGIEHLAKAVNPVHRFLIVVYFQEIIADVNDTDKGIAVGYRIRILLHIVKMGLIGLLQVIVSILAQTETALAAALVDEQIDVVGQEQTCNNYKIFSDGILTATSNSIGNTGQDTWYVASGNYTFNATYLRTNGRVHIILCDGASFTVNGSGSYGINATDNLSIYGQSQDTGTLTVNVADEKGRALYVDYGNLVVNGGVVSAHGGEYGIYINNGNLTVNGGSFDCSGSIRHVYVNGDMLMGSVLLAHHFPASDYTGTKRVKVTMNSIGIMSFSCFEDLDFSNVSGLSAYVALSDADGNGNITLTRTYKPAGLTGMVLCGEPSTTYVVPTINSNTQNYQNNRLHHVIDAMEIDKTDGYWTHYILAKKNGNVGFYPLSGKGTLKPYSAYLQLHKDAGSRGLVLNFEEEGTPTGVGHTEITESTEMADAIYDLQGRRIEKPKKGLYIVNGRKVMIK